MKDRKIDQLSPEINILSPRLREYIHDIEMNSPIASYIQENTALRDSVGTLQYILEETRKERDAAVEKRNKSDGLLSEYNRLGHEFERVRALRDDLRRDLDRHYLILTAYRSAAKTIMKLAGEESQVYRLARAATVLDDQDTDMSKSETNPRWKEEIRRRTESVKAENDRRVLEVKEVLDQKDKQIASLKAKLEEAESEETYKNMLEQLDSSRKDAAMLREALVIARNTVCENECDVEPSGTAHSPICHDLTQFLSQSSSEWFDKKIKEQHDIGLRRGLREGPEANKASCPYCYQPIDAPKKFKCNFCKDEK